jgi:tetratricopeptide (TPR) repeat protein
VQIAALRGGSVPAAGAGCHARLAALAGALLAAAGLALGYLPAPATLMYLEAAAMRAGIQALQMSDRDGAIDQALVNFDAILARQPRHAAAAAGASLAYSQRYVGDGRDETWLQRAKASAAQALRENDQLALAHAAQAWVLSLDGHGADALAAADRALALDPYNLAALQAKVNVLLRMQHYDEAARVLGDAQHRLPRERILADLEGTMHYQQGDYRGAERAFRRSLQLQPEAVLAMPTSAPPCCA